MQNEDFPALPTNQQNPSVEMQSAHGQQRMLPPSPNQGAIGSRGVLRVPPPPSSSLPEQSRPPSSGTIKEGTGQKFPIKHERKLEPLVN